MMDALFLYPLLLLPFFLFFFPFLILKFGFAIVVVNQCLLCFFLSFLSSSSSPSSSSFLHRKGGTVWLDKRAGYHGGKR